MRTPTNRAHPCTRARLLQRRAGAHRCSSDDGVPQGHPRDATGTTEQKRMRISDSLALEATYVSAHGPRLSRQYPRRWFVGSLA